MPIRRPLNKQFKLPTLRGEKTHVSKLGQIVCQTYEAEKQYLCSRNISRAANRGYLPTLEEIAEAAAIIREENDERERLEQNLGNGHYRSSYKAYRLDLTGMGARRGKLV